MMSMVDLELSLRRVDQTIYNGELRFRDESADVDLLRGGVPTIALDLEHLRQHAFNPPAYGLALSAMVFADPSLRAGLASARNQAGTRPMRLRLRLANDATLLHTVRWELLADPASDTFIPLATSERLLLSRYLSYAPSPTIRARPRGQLSAVAIVSSPIDASLYGLSSINIPNELACLRDGLTGVRLTLLARGGDAPPTLENLERALRDGPTIFYVLAHGQIVNDEAILWLEDEQGNAARASGARLASFIQDLDPQRRPLLAIIASCKSAGDGVSMADVDAQPTAIGPALVEAGLPAVIAMQGNISQATAALLLPSLLRELQRDGLIDRALAAARASVRDCDDWWMPTLFLRSRDGRLWAPPTPGSESYEVAGLQNPYPGLRAFTYDDRASFAGRERQIDAALTLLTAPGDEQTLLFVTGASGSGKSSFVQAGLLPALENHYRRRGLHTRHAVVRPGQKPLAALGDTLLQLGLPPTGPFSAARPYMLSVPEPPPTTQIALLVIDQFEELFTQAEGSQRDNLWAILESLPPFPMLRVHIIATMRSDFLPELFTQQALYSYAKQGVELRVMHYKEIEEAIRRPLEEQYPERRFEPALVKQLAAEASTEAGYLPLLQVALDTLWQRGSLSLAHYSGIADAIHQRAEQVYTYQNYDTIQYDAIQAKHREPDEQAIIIAIFLDLIAMSPNNDPRHHTRRQCQVDDLIRGDPKRDTLIADLVQARLLSRSLVHKEGHDIEMIDIIHESLIANWAQLSQAIGAQQETLQRRLRFEAALHVWFAHEQRKDFLLRQGPLAEAELLAERDDVAVRTSDGQLFLERSRTQHHAEIRRGLRIAVAILSTILLTGALVLARREILRLEAAGPELPVWVASAGVAFEPYEVTNRRYRSCVDAGACTSPIYNQSTFFLDASDDMPVTGVDAIQAAAFCRWIGRKLPRYQEWAMLLPSPTRPWPHSAWELMLKQAFLGGSGQQQTPKNVHTSQSQTPEGIYDLVGNVREWTASPQDGTVGTWDQGPLVPFTALITVGGSYRTSMPNLGLAEPPPLFPPGDRWPDLGFRCIK